MNDQHNANYAALLLRLSLGVMFLSHGLLKVFVFTPAGTAGFFASLGLPGWLAYCVSGWLSGWLAELGCAGWLADCIAD